MAHELPFVNNRITFSDFPLLPEIFRKNDPKSHVAFTSPSDFPVTFCNWYNNQYYM